jgi:U32 family peptidase
LRQSGLSRFRVELLDEDAVAAARTIRSYQDLLAGRAAADEVLGKVEAQEKLGVTEGTLVVK